MTEHEKIWKEFITFYNKSEQFNRQNYVEKYNDWLFNYTFSDVIKSDDFW